MKYLKYLVVGVFFGILMSKSEVVSWYRIYEMFRFLQFLSCHPIEISTHPKLEASFCMAHTILLKNRSTLVCRY